MPFLIWIGLWTWPTEITRPVLNFYRMWYSHHLRISPCSFVLFMHICYNPLPTSRGQKQQPTKSVFCWEVTGARRYLLSMRTLIHCGSSSCSVCSPSWVLFHSVMPDCLSWLLWRYQCQVTEDWRSHRSSWRWRTHALDGRPVSAAQSGTLLTPTSHPLPFFSKTGFVV